MRMHELVLQEDRRGSRMVGRRRRQSCLPAERGPPGQAGVRVVLRSFESKNGKDALQHPLHPDRRQPPCHFKWLLCGFRRIATNYLPNYRDRFASHLSNKTLARAIFMKICHVFNPFETFKAIWFRTSSPHQAEYRRIGCARRAGLPPAGRTSQIRREWRLPAPREASRFCCTADRPCPPRNAEIPPERLLELTRNHWRIENCLHRVLDVVMGEDRMLNRTLNGPECLAAIRRGASHFLGRRPRDKPSNQEIEPCDCSRCSI